MVVKETDEPGLFRFISDRNLLQQYDALEIDVKVALQTNEVGISHDFLKRLHLSATWYLCDNPGRYRRCPIRITNSNHACPDASEVVPLQEDLVAYIAAHWTNKSFIHLAAMVLWQICWIHPFEEGNGRTARAAAYYIICVKSGLWLPGADIIPQQIRADRTPYYAALHAADRTLLPGSPLASADLTALESYLSSLLKKQLASP